MNLTSMILIEGFRVAIGPLMELFFRMKAEGRENVPEEGGVMIVANHRCYLDPFVLALSMERFINFGAGSHLYEVPGTRKLFELAGFFPVYIYGGKEGDRSQDEAVNLLEKGEVVGLFPEGIESFMNINQVSKISVFKTGFVKVALTARVPIVPVAIVPEEEKNFPHVPGFLITPFVQHPRAADGITLITYRGITCRIGVPIDLSPYCDEVMSKDLMDHISGKIKRIVVKLYDGEDLDKFLTGETPFDFVKDRV